MDDAVRRVLESQFGLKIRRRIGRGGFSEVYEAESRERVLCAVKVSLDPLDSDSPAIRKELENLRLVQTVSGHPHVVTLMDVWVVGGYLVTRWELATDGSLLDLLHRYQREGQQGIPPEELLRYMRDAAEGIDFLNGQGIYHRDIKPQNLLLFHGRVKLADLGLAKFAGASTASHTGSGTLGYLPPEAYDQHRLSKTVDLYSLAATYLKLRTGHEPFGENPTEIIQRQTAGAPILDGLLPAEGELVLQALALKPEDRPRNGATAWVNQLHRGLQQTTTGSQPFLKDAGAIVVFLFFLGLIGAIVLPPMFGSRPEPTTPFPSSSTVSSATTAAVEWLSGNELPEYATMLGYAESGPQIREPDGHTDAVTSVASHPKEHRVLTGSRDQAVTVWDLESGQPIRQPGKASEVPVPMDTSPL